MTRASAPKKKPSLQVLERTFAILDCFSRDQPEWTTTELANAVSLPIATAHRILGVLLESGYVARDVETKRFRLGPTAVRLGDLARAALDLRRVARPVLAGLARETDETALLTVLDDPPQSGLCLDRVETSQPLRLSIERGSHIPLHAGASQKALLAYLPEPEREAFLAGRLERLCRGTITDPDALRAQLEEIRARGWAISYEENNRGAWGVAVPILRDDGEIVATIGLAGPTARLSPAVVRKHIRKLKTGAHSLAKSLGLGPQPIDTSEPVLREARVAELLQAAGAGSGDGL
jgi:DNA-binding IclR family transcriptional regulator